MLRALRRAYLRYRRIVAATLAAAAVFALARVVAPPPAESVAVVVAAHDLTGGTAIGVDDVRTARMPTGLAPSGAFTAPDRVIGSMVAAPMRAGEPLTDRRLLGPSLVAGYAPGLVAAPVRIQDADVVALLRAGDSIDLYAASSVRGPAARIATAAPVVLLPRLTSDNQAGALIVLAVTPRVAAGIAAASATEPLSVTLRG